MNHYNSNYPILQYQTNEVLSEFKQISYQNYWRNESFKSFKSFKSLIFRGYMFVYAYRDSLVPGH